MISQQLAREDLLVVTHEELRPRSESRSTQLAGPTQKQFQELRVARAVRNEIEVQNLLAFRYEEVGYPLEGGQRRPSFDRIARSALDLTIRNTVLRKKLLRAFATLSARAVVPPGHFVRGHARNLLA